VAPVKVATDAVGSTVDEDNEGDEAVLVATAEEGATVCVY